MSLYLRPFLCAFIQITNFFSTFPWNKHIRSRRRLARHFKVIKFFKYNCVTILKEKKSHFLNRSNNEQQTTNYKQGKWEFGKQYRVWLFNCRLLDNTWAYHSNMSWTSNFQIKQYNGSVIKARGKKRESNGSKYINTLTNLMSDGWFVGYLFGVL